MKWEIVRSSSIAKIGYDGPSRTLGVEFLYGAIYEYYDVPSAVYDELRRAPSIGRYVAERIKGTYRYARAE